MRIVRRLLLLSMIGTNLLSGMAGLIIFSKDRPLQLQALLESIELYVTGLSEVAVLCAASAPRFHHAYEQLSQKFPHVRWVYQDPEKQRSDFNALLQNIFNHMRSSYLMFAVDDMIIINTIDLTQCVNMLQKTHAYGCYLRLGRNTNYCYANSAPMRVPQLQHVAGEFYSWQLRTGDKCWGYPHTVDMTLYSRTTVEEAIRMFGHSSPNLFEAHWSSKSVPPHAQALCYATSRVINIPLNLVQKDFTHNHCAHRYGVEDLLNLFVQGWRINVEALHKISNNSPHFDIDPPLTKTILQPKVVPVC